MEAALLVAPGILPTAPQAAGNPGPGNDPGTDGAFSKLLGSLLGKSTAQARNDAGAAAADTADRAGDRVMDQAQDQAADQTADPAQDQAEDASGYTLLMALISLLPGQLQGSPASQVTADGSSGSSPAAAADSLTLLISQVRDYLERSGSGGRFAGDWLAALDSLAGVGANPGDIALAGNTGLAAEATTAAPYQYLGAALSDLNGTGLQATSLPEAAPTAVGQAESGTPDATVAAGQTTADQAARPVIAGVPAQLANDSAAAGGAPNGPGTAGAADDRPALQAWPAITEASSSRPPAKTVRAQTAVPGLGPTIPGQAAAGDASSPASATGKDPAAGLPEQSTQAPGTTAPPKETQEEAAPLKLARAPSTQAQTSSLQAPSGPGEMKGLLTHLTQPPPQQPGLSPAAAGKGQEAGLAFRQFEAGLIGQIVDNARLVANGSSASMKIRLKPEFLGDLKLVVRVENGVVNAHFLTQNQDTASLIQNRLPELKQALDDQGISWQHLSVSSGGSQGNYQGASGQAQQHPGQFYAQPGYGYEGDPGLDELPAAEVYQWTGSGTFNYVI